MRRRPGQVIRVLCWFEVESPDNHGLDYLHQAPHFRKVCTPEPLKRAEASRACPRALPAPGTQPGALSQSLLLGSQSDMEAIERVRKHAGALMNSQAACLREGCIAADQRIRPGGRPHTVQPGILAN